MKFEISHFYIFLKQVVNNELFIHLKVLFFMLPQDIFTNDSQTLENLYT